MHESAVQIKDRYVRFANIFLSFRRINVSELNCKRPNVTTQ